MKFSRKLNMQVLLTFLSPFLTLLHQPKTHQATEQIHHLHLRRSSSVAELSLTAKNKKFHLYTVLVSYFNFKYTIPLYKYSFMINIQSGYMYNYTCSGNWANILRVARSLHTYDVDVFLR